MSSLVIEVDRAGFLTAERMLQNSSKQAKSCVVFLRLKNGRLQISSEAGKVELTCDSPVEASAQLNGSSFCKLVAAHGHEKNLSGNLKLTLRPEEKEIATPKKGVRVKRIEVKQ